MGTNSDTQIGSEKKQARPQNNIARVACLEALSTGPNRTKHRGRVVGHPRYKSRHAVPFSFHTEQKCRHVYQFVHRKTGRATRREICRYMRALQRYSKSDSLRSLSQLLNSPSPSSTNEDTPQDLVPSHNPSTPRPLCETPSVIPPTSVSDTHVHEEHKSLPVPLRLSASPSMSRRRLASNGLALEHRLQLPAPPYFRSTLTPRLGLGSPNSPDTPILRAISSAVLPSPLSISSREDSRILPFTPLNQILPKLTSPPRHYPGPSVFRQTLKLPWLTPKPGISNSGNSCEHLPLTPNSPSLPLDAFQAPSTSLDISRLTERFRELRTQSSDDSSNSVLQSRQAVTPDVTRNQLTLKTLITSRAKPIRSQSCESVPSLIRKRLLVPLNSFDPALASPLFKHSPVLKDRVVSSLASTSPTSHITTAAPKLSGYFDL